MPTYPKIRRRSKTTGWLPFSASILLFNIPLGLQTTDNVYQNQQTLHEDALRTASTVGLDSTYTYFTIYSILYLISIIIYTRERSYSKATNDSRSTIVTYITIILAFMPILSVITAGWSLLVFTNIVHIIGLNFIALAAALHYEKQNSDIVSHVKYSIAIVVIIHILFALFQPALGVNFDGRWSGLNRNPNTLGMQAFVLFWAATYSASTSTKKTFENNVLLLVAAFALIASGSATSLICAAVVFFWKFLPKSLLSDSGAHWTTARIVSVSLVALLFIQLPQIADQTNQIFEKSDGFSGRYLLWEYGYQAFLERPVLGWGYDNNLALIEYLRIPTTHFHNGYLNLALKLGMFGLILLILCLINEFVERRLMRDPLDRGILAFLIGASLYNVSEVAFVEPRNTIWMITITMLLMRQRNLNSKGGILGGR